MKKLDLITGFLGAGKTTFIKKYAKYLIEKGEKVAIIENEFGVAGVDTAILKNDDIEVSQLVGGCICCSQKVNFHNLIISLAKEYDKIIVEPSGIFNINDFFDVANSPKVKEVCEIGSVITIVDPKSISVVGEVEQEMMYSQLMFSGKVILSKTDNLSSEEIKQANDQLNKLINKYSEGVIQKDIQEKLITKPWNTFTKNDLKALCDVKSVQVSCKRMQLDHSALFASTTISVNNMELGELQMAILKIIDGSCGEILRIKGYIASENGKYFEVNCTTNDISIKPCEKGEAMLNIIGKKLNRKLIKEYLIVS